ncbi:cytochrome c peroxidase [Thalassoglobus polymorphus]|uniref:Di-heme cytochrome c peroxidase n=1 Tax=Thalassoglobus polymorphus TaxID=2527994 RepID=A0A517QVB5_9PLAN|nr:cytochrome c peroxidase [Thalassoglobus polymorphus]QDT35570.1 Di-heme cytochrome c peroxidase [Thalassoglobus polymorphus]
MPTSRLFQFLLFSALCTSTLLLAAEPESRYPLREPQQPLRRRPASMCWVPEAQILAIANERGSTISLLAPTTGKVQEADINASPTKLIWIDRLHLLAIVDTKSGRVLFASLKPGELSVQQSIEIGRGAQSLCLSPDESLLAVSSVWDRHVSLISVEPIPKVQSTIPLKFEPSEVCFSPDGTMLIVADAFGGELVVIDTKSQTIVGQTKLHAHQIRGIAFLSADRCLLTHQILFPDIPTTPNNIASGRVLENVVQELQFTRTSRSRVDVQSLGIQEIGVPSDGAADPGAIHIAKSSERFVALAGVNEVATMNSYGVVRNRIRVGKRPVDLVISPDQKQIYCLNNLSDSVSVIDLKKQLVTKTIPLGPQPQLTSRDRGEELFFDGNISRFGWYSCQSCHIDGHTNTQLADTFGDGNAGAPKRVPSLLGGRDDNPWAWNGTMRSLHDQVLLSGDSTMRGGGLSARQANDLVAFLHTLEHPPPFQPAQDEQDKRLIAQGLEVFTSQGCAKCHVPPLTYTSDSTYDVGLEDEHGLKKFNPPSLNAVGYRRSFFHDSRAKSLPEVFTHFGHQLDDSLSDQHLKALLRFLQSL